MFHCLFLLQLEDGIDFLSMYNGGSEDSEMVAKLTGTMNDAIIITSVGPAPAD